MSKTVKGRLHYINFSLDGTEAGKKMLHTLAKDQIVVIDEATLPQVGGTGHFGHLAVLKDPTAPVDRFRSEQDALYPDTSGTSIKYFDSMQDLIPYLIDLHDLIGMQTGKSIEVIVAGTASSNLMGQVAEHYAGAQGKMLKWDETQFGFDPSVFNSLPKMVQAQMINNILATSYNGR